VTTELKKQADAERPLLNPPNPARQVRFYQLLAAARKQWFIDALSEALGQLDPKIVKEQIGDYVPSSAQRILATAGIRDEYVFPVPIIIETKPHLIGYYRLILGAPQKTFYKGSTGLGRFKGMEERGAISEKQKALMPAFCRAMARPLAELLRQIPNITERDLRELPLLTYGSQLQGSDNTQIGKAAMRGVFLAVTEVVQSNIADKAESCLKVKNAAGRTVVITLSQDPDVRIEEYVENQVHRKVAIEVKGGTDVSNAHNRAGEAEKSHQKAKKLGFPEFWTIISKEGGLEVKLRAESPTTNHWFDVGEVLARKGKDWEEFRQRLTATVGLPVSDVKKR
jgi:XcyI restriction endonuclease